ncbi:hypothetical protein [Flavimaricola marinus]|uniref:Outer membrane protein beta-barrel domain-containing protein n=1 Tax=Flavimaricola marinus TaxID=1819565 RepID=A0A238LA49_9RHOB|nr:hypothetical protein [Flavimaricola marinus]SMY06528.1 hypothetical protein LOM8899_00655 [Flavimaricola marinus]
MLRPVLAPFFALLLAATQSHAGAWPRAEGETFLSFGGNVALFGEAVRPVYYDPTVYLEYGLTERWTVGIDGFTSDKGTAGSLFVFVRYPLSHPDNPDKLAVSVGTGATLMPNGALEETPRIGLHWGRGFANGWMAADTELTYGLTRGIAQTKIDVTIGYDLNDDWTTVLVSTAGIGLTGDVYVKTSPSLLYHFNDTVSLRMGLVQALSGDFGSGLSLEAWLRF